MDFSIDTSKINMNMYIKPIQPANLPIKDISDFPSKQAEVIQKHLLEIDKQGKLKEEFLKRYGNNLGKPNSLANYILEDFENRKHLFIEYTGIETFSDKHTIKRIGIKLNEISYASNRYFLWKCSTCQYEWTATLKARTIIKTGCPACAGNILIKGKNDLETFCKQHSEFTHLLDEFVGEDEKHNKILPSEILKASHKEVWWKCSTCGHGWKAAVASRTYNKSGCPECGKKRRAEAAHLQGESLQHWCDTNGKYGQQLKSEFVGKLEDGTPVTLGELSKGSNIRAWWKCSNPNCEYKWVTQPNMRTSENFRSGCPACSKYTFTPGVNDLETYCHQHPELNYILEEFVGIDENKQPIKPFEVARGSIKKVLWRCSKCHKTWLAAIVNRTNHKSGCPYCTAHIFTSFPEQFMYHSLKQIFPNTENRWKDPVKGFEYDIVIPELKLCIEYSGVNWHADKLDRDQAKADHCKANKINFLQIYAHHGEITDEQDLEINDIYTKEQIVYKANNDKTLHIIQLQHIIEYILKEYSPNHSINEIDFTLAEQQANKVMGKA